MRIVTTLGFALLAICLIGATSVSAQVPNIGVYFDGIKTDLKVCPGILLDTLYVVARDVGGSISAAEYRIDYSPGSGYLSWIGDIPSHSHPYSSKIGSSPTGVSLGWDLPGHDFLPIILQRVLILWNCAGCAALDVDLPPLIVPLLEFHSA